MAIQCCITADDLISDTWCTCCSVSLSISTVERVLVVVESLGPRVPPADVRLEAVLVLGDVRALGALEPHAGVHVQVLHVARDPSPGRQHLVAWVAHETPIHLGDVFVDERILKLDEMFLS